MGGGGPRDPWRIELYVREMRETKGKSGVKENQSGKKGEKIAHVVGPPYADVSHVREDTQSAT
jgi:hypothetical protein